MSSDNSNASNGNNQGDGSNKLPMTLPSFNFKELKQKALSQVHSSVKTIVDTANSVLGKVQTELEQVKMPVTNAVNAAESYSDKALTGCRRLYEQRHQYAPYWVGGSALFSGAFFALRRGKFHGLFVGTVVGTIVYVGLYGDESALRAAPEFSFPSISAEKLQQSATKSLDNLKGKSSAQLDSLKDKLPSFPKSKDN